MTIVPSFLKRDLSLKLLALTIAIVVYFALRERDADSPPPITLPTASMRSELPTHIVVVSEAPDGSTSARRGRLVRGTDEDGKTIFKWLDEAASNPKPAHEQTLNTKGSSHAVLPIR